MDKGADSDQVRQLAASLGYILEEDFRILACATQLTIEAWRKRGQGPAYVRLGNRVLYPHRAVAEYLDSIIRERQPAAPAI